FQFTLLGISPVIVPGQQLAGRAVQFQRRISEILVDRQQRSERADHDPLGLRPSDNETGDQDIIPAADGKPRRDVSQLNRRGSVGRGRSGEDQCGRTKESRERESKEGRYAKQHRRSLKGGAGRCQPKTRTSGKIPANLRTRENFLPRKNLSGEFALSPALSGNPRR